MTKTMKTCVLMLVLLLLAGCKTAPGNGGSGSDFGGDINSENGKAWISAIKGKLFEDANHTKSIPVDDEEVLSIPGGYFFFAGAPSATTAYYYVAMEQDSERNPINNKTFVQGFIIQDNKLYYADFVIGGDTIAQDINPNYATEQDLWDNGTEAEQKEYNKRLYSKDNTDLSKPNLSEVKAYIKN